MKARGLPADAIPALQAHFSCLPNHGTLWSTRPDGTKALIWSPEMAQGADTYFRFKFVHNGVTYHIAPNRLMWILATGSQPPGKVSPRDGNLFNIKAENLRSGCYSSLAHVLKCRQTQPAHE